MAALLVLLAMLPPGAAGARCDYDQSFEVPIGLSRVSVVSHRCHYEDGNVRYTQRLDRIDAFVQDASSPRLPTTAATALFVSEHAQHPDGSSTTRSTLHVSRDASWAEVVYADARDGRGSEDCKAGAEATRGPPPTITAYTPTLPTCAPPQLLA